jgi:hypothetical protein
MEIGKMKKNEEINFSGPANIRLNKIDKKNLPMQQLRAVHYLRMQLVSNA